MPAKAVITTPFPTVQETAKEMGVAEKRVRLLSRLMMAIVRGTGGAAASTPKRGAKRGVTKRKRAARR